MPDAERMPCCVLPAWAPAELRDLHVLHIWSEADWGERGGSLCSGRAAGGDDLPGRARFCPFCLPACLFISPAPCAYMPSIVLISLLLLR